MSVVDPLLANADEAPPLRWSQRWRALVSARRAGSLPLHCLMAVPAALLPSAAFFLLARAVASALGLDVAALSPPQRETTLDQFFGAVVFAPVVETLLLMLLLRGLVIVMRRPVRVAAVSAVVWGVLHGLQGPLWFFGTAWSFYIFSASYQAWRPVSRRHAFAAAAVPHAAINLVAMLSLLLP